MICLCGHEFEGRVISGKMVTPHMICPACGKECVVAGECEIQKGFLVNHAIRREKDGLPVSRFLPLRAGGKVVTDGGRKIKVHADGMRTDLRGRPIVATREDQRRVESFYQVERE